jgi:hypothetical protein
MRVFERGSGHSATGPRVSWNTARRAVSSVERNSSGGGLRLHPTRIATWFGRCPAFRPMHIEDEKRGRLVHCDD